MLMSDTLSFKDHFAQASVHRYDLGHEMCFVSKEGNEEVCRCIYEQTPEVQQGGDGQQDKVVLIVEVQWHCPRNIKHFVEGVSISKVPEPGEKFYLREANIASGFEVVEITSYNYIEGTCTVIEARTDAV